LIRRQVLHARHLFAEDAAVDDDVLAGDANGDSVVDVADLGVLGANFNQSNMTLAFSVPTGLHHNQQATRQPWFLNPQRYRFLQ